jgi:hypothetical protein
MPWGVAIDNEREYVIVTDTGNHRVQVIVIIIIIVVLSCLILRRMRALTTNFCLDNTCPC